VAGKQASSDASLRPVLFVALVTGLCLLGDSALYALLPSRLEVFAVTPTAAGLILGVNRYIRILSNNLAARIFESKGFYGPFMGAVLLSVATTAGYGLFVGFWPLFMAHCLWGVAWSILRLGGYLAVIESARGPSIGRLMGVLQSISRGGSVIAVMIGGLLADMVGSALATLAAIPLVPFCGVPRSLGRRSGAPTTVATEQKRLSIDRRQIWVLYAVAAVAWLLINGLVVATAGYLIRTIVGEGTLLLGVFVGVGTLTGTLLAMRWLSDLGLSPLFGHASDNVGRSKVITTAMAVAIVSLALVALDQSLFVVIPTLGTVFICGTALFVSLNAAIGTLAPPHRRTAILGWYTTWADIGSGTGPVLGFVLITKIGFGWLYGGAALLLALTMSLYLWTFATSRYKVVPRSRFSRF
jgi:MFS family permease